MYGALLAASLKNAMPDCKLFGIGLSKMKAAGVDFLVDFSAHSVMGITEIFGALFRSYKIIKQVENFFEKNNISALILIDYAGFNLKLAAAARKFNIPVFYFVPPKLWAWGEFRVAKVKRNVDKIYSIFPFEKSFFKKHGIDNEFYGHPIFDIINYAGFDYSNFLKLEKAGMNMREQKIILMPGSRTQEIKSLLPLMVKSAERFSLKYSQILPALEFVLPLADGADVSLIRTALSKSKIKYRLVTDELEKYNEFSRAIMAFAASGTATLELALFGVPSITLYKASVVTELAAKMLLNVKYISLPNILLDAPVIPELTQRMANVDNVVYNAGVFIEKKDYAAGVKKSLLSLADMLIFDPKNLCANKIAADICGKICADIHTSKVVK